MPTLQQLIAEKFLNRLKEGQVLDRQALKQLSDLFGAGKKIKADDLVKVFTSPPGGEVQ
jgi:hypothetical protein